MLKNNQFRSLLLLGSFCTLLASAGGFFFTGTDAGLLLLLLGTVLTGLFILYTKQRYRELDRLNQYLADVLAGEKLPEIVDQKEGELSILKTNLYKAATMLIYQKQLLSEDKKMLAEAIADISHQLKTPLTSIMVMNDLLMDEENLEKRREFLTTQSAQLDRMNWLIQTLLKLSKLDAGTIEMKREPIAVTDLVQASLKPFAIQMELKEIKANTNCGDLRVSCDPNWTMEALQNIVKNCCEHMDAGEELTIEAEDNSLFLLIRISDTGCGIAEEDLPHIFKRFYKGKNAGKDSVGIGLALSQSIIESQHGEILVQSEEGAGTQFDIRFYKTIL